MTHTHHTHSVNLSHTATPTKSQRDSGFFEVTNKKFINKKHPV